MENGVIYHTVGIVINNGIVLVEGRRSYDSQSCARRVDYINQLRARGKGFFKAIMEAGQVRMRPVLLPTALTTILAMLPLENKNN